MKKKKKEKEIKKIFNSTSKPTHSSNFAALTNQPQKRIAQWLRRLRKLYRPSLGHRNLSLLVLPTPKTTKTPQPPSTTNYHHPANLHPLYLFTHFTNQTCRFLWRHSLGRVRRYNPTLSSSSELTFKPCSYYPGGGVVRYHWQRQGKNSRQRGNPSRPTATDFCRQAAGGWYARIL